MLEYSVPANAVMMELADMQDLGSCAFGVWVRLPLTAVKREVPKR